MKIALIGAGGVGGFFGGKIAQSGFDVTFVTHGEHLEAIRRNGLTVKSIQGNFHLDSVQTTDKIQNIRNPDLIILGVKAWQVKEIANELKSVINANTTILPLQNGVLAPAELKEHIHEYNVISGLCKIMSKIESPGIINHSGVTPTIVFGDPNNSNTERLY